MIEIKVVSLFQGNPRMITNLSFEIASQNNLSTSNAYLEEPERKGKEETKKQTQQTLCPRHKGSNNQTKQQT